MTEETASNETSCRVQGGIDERTSSASPSSEPVRPGSRRDCNARARRLERGAVRAHLAGRTACSDRAHGELPGFPEEREASNWPSP